MCSQVGAWVGRFEGLQIYVMDFDSVVERMDFDQGKMDFDLGKMGFDLVDFDKVRQRMTECLTAMEELADFYQKCGRGNQMTMADSDNLLSSHGHNQMEGLLVYHLYLHQIFHDPYLQSDYCCETEAVAVQNHSWHSLTETPRS